MELEYVPTHLMLADVLTKPLNGGDFHSLVRLLLGRNNFQASYASNRGAKNIMLHADETVEQLTAGFSDMNCLHQAAKQRRRKIQRNQA